MYDRTIVFGHISDKHKSHIINGKKTLCGKPLEGLWVYRAEPDTEENICAKCWTQIPNQEKCKNCNHYFPMIGSELCRECTHELILIEQGSIQTINY